MKIPVDFEKDNKNVKNLLPLKKKAAFTLTEVLLAVLIVGIIAAMVLPAIVTKYQDKAFESAFNREVHSLQDSIDSLAAVENQPSFYETTLATNTGTYMKKYLRVSKYCETSGKDCFGKFYSEYSGHEKKTYTPSYDGSCAILKNGTSVCLSVNGGNVNMLIDVNGPKGPNVLGRDLRTYTHSVRSKTGYDMSPSGIIALNQPPIRENDDSDPCEGKTCGCGDLPDCDPCAGKTCGCGDLPACIGGGTAGFALHGVYSNYGIPNGYYTATFVASGAKGRIENVYIEPEVTFTETHCKSNDCVTTTAKTVLKNLDDNYNCRAFIKKNNGEEETLTCNGISSNPPYNVYGTINGKKEFLCSITENPDGNPKVCLYYFPRN